MKIESGLSLRTIEPGARATVESLESRLLAGQPERA